MKKSLAVTAFLMALVFLISACAAEQPATETAQTEEETVTEAFEGMTDADYAYLYQMEGSIKYVLAMKQLKNSNTGSIICRITRFSKNCIVFFGHPRT